MSTLSNPSPILPPVSTVAAATSPLVEERVVTFADFGLDSKILRAITETGYTSPTPIQAQAIPVVLAGRDVMGSAQTGTGKTASFVLPILQNILPLASHSTSPARHPVRALVLAPTRELAVQVADNAAVYAKHTPIRSTVVFGGTDIKVQAPIVRAGVELLIATPGRLLDHIEQGNVSLSQVQYLVLDEADRMLDMGFLPDLQRILNLLPKKRQTLLFSATFSPEIRKLAESYQTQPVTIETAQRNATSNNVSQEMFRVKDKHHKRSALVQLIQQENIAQSMIFVNTKIEARDLARFLQKAKINARALHGDQTQNERLATLDEFKRGEVLMMVATDVAARGLDIAQMPCVVNFDLPYNAEDYVHRIGRTGRAGASGRALSLVTEHDDKLLAAISKLVQTQFELKSIRSAESPASSRATRTEPTTHPRKARNDDSAEFRNEYARIRQIERNAPHRRNAWDEEELNYLRRKIQLSNDPFFSQPYQASERAPALDLAHTQLTATMPLPKSKKPVAALFAMGKKK